VLQLIKCSNYIHIMVTLCTGPPKPPPKTTPLRQMSLPGAFMDRSARGESLFD